MKRDDLLQIQVDGTSGLGGLRAAPLLRAAAVATPKPFFNPRAAADR